MESSPGRTNKAGSGLSTFSPIRKWAYHRTTVARTKTAKMKPKPRRAKGAGSVIRRGNTWYGRLRRDGQEILTEGYATADKAEEALDRLIGGQVDPRTLPTLEAYWESLIAPGGDFEHRYDAPTCNLYDTVLAQHVRGKPLGKTRLDQIRKVDVQRHVDRLYKNLAESTVRRYGSCVHTVLQNAVDAGVLVARLDGGQVLPANPADGVKYRKLPDAPSYIFSDEELRLYPELLYAFHPRLSAMVTVIADTGARPGEVCAMTTEDLRGDVWTIAAMITRKGIRKESTKTGRIRTVTLSPDALAAIEDQGRRRGLVFLNEDGNPIKPDALYTHLRRFRLSLQKKEDETARKEGRPPRSIPPLHPRNLRKTFVTRGVEMGDAKAVQAAVGHSSIRTTLDIYAKARQNPQRKLIESLSEGVSRSIWRDKGKDRGKKPVSDSSSEPT